MRGAAVRRALAFSLLIGLALPLGGCYYPYYGYYGYGYPYYGSSYYGYGYGYGYGYLPSSSTVYAEQSHAASASAPASNYWYYCSNPQGYYPYVKECPAGWQKVAPQPPAH